MMEPLSSALTDHIHFLPNSMQSTCQIATNTGVHYYSIRDIHFRYESGPIEAIDGYSVKFSSTTTCYDIHFVRPRKANTATDAAKFMQNIEKG